MPKLQLGRIGTCPRINPAGGHGINYMNPLSSKLVWCCAGGTRELVSGYPGSHVPFGGNIGSFFGKTRMGRSLESANDGPGFSWAQSRLLEQRITKNFSVAFWMHVTNNFGYIWTKNWNGSTEWKHSIGVSTDGANNTIDIAIYDSGGNRSQWDGPANMYTYGTDGLRFITFVRNAGNGYFYADGIYKGSDSDTDRTIDWTNSIQRVCMFTRTTYNSGDGLVGCIPLFMLFDEALTQGEILSLYNDPYQLIDDDIPVVSPAILATGTTGLFPFFMHSLRQ